MPRELLPGNCCGDACKATTKSHRRDKVRRDRGRESVLNLPHLAIMALVVVLGWPARPGSGSTSDTRRDVFSLEGDRPEAALRNGVFHWSESPGLSGPGSSRLGSSGPDSPDPRTLQSALQPATWWFSGGNPSPEEIRIDDANSFLHLSEKEFRELDTLIHSAGFVLRGLQVGAGGLAEVELSFDFERPMTEQENVALRQAVERQYGTLSALRKAIVLTLMEAGRHGEAKPAQGFRLHSISLRLSNPSDVQLRFRRSKP